MFQYLQIISKNELHVVYWMYNYRLHYLTPLPDNASIGHKQIVVSITNFKQFICI